jgi:hypothetical protein
VAFLRRERVSDMAGAIGRVGHQKPFGSTDIGIDADETCFGRTDALVDKLPPPDSVWSIDDRAKWLKAVAMIFNLVYRTTRTYGAENRENIVDRLY